MYIQRVSGYFTLEFTNIAVYYSVCHVVILELQYFE